LFSVLEFYLWFTFFIVHHRSIHLKSREKEVEGRRRKAERKIAESL
jgi:hypothetical protein